MAEPEEYQEDLKPTPERMAKGDCIEEEETTRAGQYCLRNRDCTVLNRYLRRNQLGPANDKNKPSREALRRFDAGLRLYSDWYWAGRSPRVTGSYDVRIGGSRVQFTPQQAKRFRTFTQAMKYLGNALTPIVLHVILYDNTAGSWAKNNGYPNDDGIAQLRLALDTLADFYGY